MAEIILATMEQLTEISELYRRCTEDMDNKGIYQWDESYPNRDFYEDTIEAEEMYVLLEGGVIRGAVVLNDWQSPEWQEIPWSRADGHYLVIHALAIHPDYQGQGYGRMLLQFTERFASASEFTGIRLDAFTENPIANSLYLRHGYKCMGQVYFAMKRQPYNWYYCYEKMLAR